MRVAIFQVGHAQDANWSAPLGLQHPKAAAPDPEAALVLDRPPTSLVGIGTIGVYSLSQDWDDALAYGRAAAKAGVTVIYGGPHVTAVGHADGFPFIPGNAELAFRNWLTTGEIKDIQQCSLDDLPIPGRGFGKPYIITSRGCPYKCPFCSSSRLSPQVRFHSPARVVTEMVRIRLRDKSLRHLTIWDDLFAVDAARLRKIAALVATEPLLRGLTFSCSMRAELCTDARLAPMKEMGVNRCGIGAESASPEILGQLKPGASADCNQAAIDKLAAYGMRPGAGVIFGHWFETEADVEMTYRWLMKNYASGALYAHTPNILTPLPATPVWEYADRMGYVGGADWRWSRLRYISRAGFPSAKAWLDAREANDSVYMGGVPWQTLREMIEHYEGRIERGDFGVRGKIGAGTKMRVRSLRGRASRGYSRLRSLRGSSR